MMRKSNTRLFETCGKAGPWEIWNTNGIGPAEKREKEVSRDRQN